jgi:hypothetical protein
MGRRLRFVLTGGRSAIDELYDCPGCDVEFPAYMLDEHGYCDSCDEDPFGTTDDDEGDDGEDPFE